MKNRKPIFVIILFVFNLGSAQVNLLTEDFETDGEGTRYTSNTFFDSCNDLFERSSNGGEYCMTNEPTNVSGTFYWAGEDCDVASGGTGILTLDPITVTGFNLEMKVMLAVERPNDGRFETNDELLFQYNMDGGGWNNFVAFYGSFEGSGQTKGDLTQDADFNGQGDPGGIEIESSDFVDLTFSIPATGNSIEIRFVMGQDQGTEGVMLDNIRINSVIILPIELVEFSLEEIENRMVNINWETRLEQHNDYFIVERSNDGNSWQELTRVNGEGTSNDLSSYTTIDDEPFTGLSYYRLKQVDFDGTITISNIKSINIEDNSTYRPISIYPNPSNSVFMVEGDISELSDLQIINSNGQEVSNLLSTEHIYDFQLNFDSSSLPNGTYFIKTKTTVNKIYIFHTP